MYGLPFATNACRTTHGACPGMNRDCSHVTWRNYIPRKKGLEDTSISDGYQTYMFLGCNDDVAFRATGNPEVLPHITCRSLIFLPAESPAGDFHDAFLPASMPAPSEKNKSTSSFKCPQITGTSLPPKANAPRPPAHLCMLLSASFQRLKHGRLRG